MQGRKIWDTEVIGGYVGRKTQKKNGVLSPFLWILAVNQLLRYMEEEEAKVIAYEDNLAVMRDE